jgi:copper chaperone CopZ
MDENCRVDPVEKAVTVQQIRSADRAILSIGGMGCSNCAMRVHNGLLAVDGVYKADVYLKLALAEVYYDRCKVTMDALKAAVHRAGNDGRHEYYAAVIAAE